MKTPAKRRTPFEEIPITARMVARPVWARHERRVAGEELEPPTEAEKYDAIRVLEAAITVPLSLYAEAERILHDSI